MKRVIVRTNGVHNIHTLKNLAENDVPAIQPARHNGGNELHVSVSTMSGTAL